MDALRDMVRSVRTEGISEPSRAVLQVSRALAILCDIAPILDKTIDILLLEIL